MAQRAICKLGKPPPPDLLPPGEEEIWVVRSCPPPKGKEEWVVGPFPPPRGKEEWVVRTFPPPSLGEDRREGDFPGKPLLESTTRWRQYFQCGSEALECPRIISNWRGDKNRIFFLGCGFHGPGLRPALPDRQADISFLVFLENNCRPDGGRDEFVL